jgi:predicted nucleotidyltransferase
MKIIAVICEYNPFHLGHEAHLAFTKKVAQADAVLCLMSGSYCQRGTPAVADKYLRAEAAVRAGADIVIELPPYFATANAETFARGAVGLLNLIPGVTRLSFGSECGDLDTLYAASAVEENGEFKTVLRDNLNNGLGYPLSRSNALAAVSPEAAAALSLPNNILAAEYLRALNGSGSAITPVTVRRVGAGHGADAEICSASAIRGLLERGDLASAYKKVPAYAREVLTAAAQSPADKRILWALLRERLADTPAEELEKLYDYGEGLAYRIKERAAKSTDYDRLLEAALSKRYTRAKVRRLLLYALLRITAADVEAAFSAPYLNVLAINKNRTELLSVLPDCAITRNSAARAGDPVLRALIEKHARADDLYCTLTGRPSGLFWKGMRKV